MIVTHKQHGHMQVNANPTIQMTTPMTERMRATKAKGRPRRNPSGLHSQSSPQQQLIDCFLCCSCFSSTSLELVGCRRRYGKATSFGLLSIVGNDMTKE
ncbi:hypothetical protein ACFX2H_004839 [Malus domestica]